MRQIYEDISVSCGNNFFVVACNCIFSQDTRSMIVGTAKKRLALVIGNASYRSPNSLCLTNGVCPPVNDALDLSAALKDVGFEVMEGGINVTKAEMRKLLFQFENKLKSGMYQVALFYFAGHGSGLETGNYLYPVDVPNDVAESEVEDYCINLKTIFGRLNQVGVNTCIVLLDACRENPYERGWSRSTGDHGLREPDLPDETFVGFGTKAHFVAKNGSSNGRNGLFTAGLLKHLRTPGLSLDDFFIEVTSSVKADAARMGFSQTPEKKGNLGKRIYFVPFKGVSPIGPEPKPVPVPSNKNYTEMAFGLGMDMVYVEGGSYLMGCSGADADNLLCGGLKPATSVNVKNIYVAQTEVTQKQWRLVMGTNRGFNSGCDDCPVELVSWEDAQAFIRLLNEKTGKNYRLPREAEWEYAARGGKKSAQYPFAGGTNMEKLGWTTSNSGGKSQPVAGKEPNELGIYDMSGNVWEWCSDWYLVNSSRLIRGGSWSDIAGSCRVSNRSYNAPANHGKCVGFRLVRD